MSHLPAVSFNNYTYSCNPNSLSYPLQYATPESTPQQKSPSSGIDLLVAAATSSTASLSSDSLFNTSQLSVSCNALKTNSLEPHPVASNRSEGSIPDDRTRADSVVSHISSTSEYSGSGSSDKQDITTVGGKIVQKDANYWAKRRKNNEAARKSREKRRINDIVMENKLMLLTEENSKLKCLVPPSSDDTPPNPAIQTAPTVPSLQSQIPVDSSKNAFGSHNSAFTSPTNINYTPNPEPAVTQRHLIPDNTAVPSLPQTGLSGLNLPFGQQFGITPPQMNYQNLIQQSMLNQFNGSNSPLLSLLSGNMGILPPQLLSAAFGVPSGFFGGTSVPNQPATMNHNGWESAATTPQPNQNRLPVPSSTPTPTQVKSIVPAKRESPDTTWKHEDIAQASQGYNKSVPPKKRRKNLSEMSNDQLKSPIAIPTQIPIESNREILRSKLLENHMPKVPVSSPSDAPLTHPVLNSLLSGANTTPIMQTNLSNLLAHSALNGHLPIKTEADSSMKNCMSKLAITLGGHPSQELQSHSLHAAVPPTLMGAMLQEGYTFSPTSIGGDHASGSDHSIGSLDDHDDHMSESQHEFNGDPSDPQKVKYLERRRKNNEAAKRCRANRRAMFDFRFKRSQELETENTELRNEMESLKKMIASLRDALLIKNPECYQQLFGSGIENLDGEPQNLSMKNTQDFHQRNNLQINTENDQSPLNSDATSTLSPHSDS